MKTESFSRTAALLGSEITNKICNSRILIAGLGGVGSYAAECLARCGTGSFLLIDSDTIDESNINRQLYALNSTVGKLKTDVAKQRILDINKDAQVITEPVFLDETNIEDILLSYKPNLVIDAIDSTKSKCLLLEKAYEMQIPAISSMGAALKTDSSKITSADLMQTTVCPLAKTVRTQLKTKGITNGITAVYSTEKPKEKNYGFLGSLGFITGIFGLKIAEEAIKIISGEKNA